MEKEEQMKEKNVRKEIITLRTKSKKKGKELKKKKDQKLMDRYHSRFYRH